IGSMLGIAGYQVVEIAIQRRFKSQKGDDDAGH
ncbi:holin, partial [Salmonella enterica]|nr:holin [Salmonella enterica]